MLKSENPMDVDEPWEDANFKREKETKEEQDSEGLKQELESTATTVTADNFKAVALGTCKSLLQKWGNI